MHTWEKVTILPLQESLLRVANNIELYLAGTSHFRLGFFLPPQHKRSEVCDRTADRLALLPFIVQPFDHTAYNSSPLLNSKQPPNSDIGNNIASTFVMSLPGEEPAKISATNAQTAVNGIPAKQTDTL
jgi:hypothetical protein